MNRDEARRAWARTTPVSTALLAALVDAATSPGHHHRKHATWDAGQPCYRCQRVDEARAIIGYPCRSCAECTGKPVYDLHEGQRT